jgi:E3 Ubiquitin ligase
LLMILVIEATVIFKKIWCSDRNIFRQDGQRTIADTLNVVPFGVRVGRSLVEIEDPREVACQSLRTVASEYKQKSLNVLEQIWGFLVGTRHRGIQSTEEMLLVGTKLTAIGSLAKGQFHLPCSGKQVAKSKKKAHQKSHCFHLVADKSMSSTEGVSMSPYILSELTVTELRKRLRISRRWALLLLITAGCAGAALVTIVLRRAMESQRIEVCPIRELFI